MSLERTLVFDLSSVQNYDKISNEIRTQFANFAKDESLGSDAHLSSLTEELTRKFAAFAFKTKEESSRHQLTGWFFGENVDSKLVAAIPKKYLITSKEWPLAVIKEILAQTGLEGEWSGIDSDEWKGENFFLIYKDPSILKTVTDRLGAKSLESVQVSSNFGARKAIFTYYGTVKNPKDWTFDAEGYLKSKNVVDRESFNQSVWQEVAVQCKLIEDELNIIEIGAGNLSMLDAISTLRGKFTKIVYTALERETHLIEAGKNKLRTLGYAQRGVEYIKEGEPTIVVRVVEEDLLNYKVENKCHLIIGCCFADLIFPEPLVNALLNLSKGALVYFPITFTASTKLVPPYQGEGVVPSDTFVETAYHQSLADQGQNLNHQLIIQEFEKRGGKFLKVGDSHWKMDPNNPDHNYVWNCMWYFIGTGTTKTLCPEYRLDRWMLHHQNAKSHFDISNVDLLLRLPE